ncbi:MAG: LUD domain-containing protein [SAR324 cluster bacterium]|nr:LUD domain-containing protein [SAR324 cluster bacterium]
MSSRNYILQALRNAQNNAPELQHPGSFDQAVLFDDPVEQFIESVQVVAGTPVICADLKECAQQIEKHELFREANILCNLEPNWNFSASQKGSGKEWMEVNEQDDPHSFEKVDLCIMQGQFGVAENGAIWIDSRFVAQQAVLFLTQHLILTVPRQEIVQNMHQAYARLSFDSAYYGCFIAGPSKTADIEQALVIGAHGPRSLTVYLIG